MVRKAATVCISGTPGTGKTSVSRILSQMTGWRMIEINDFARERGLIAGFDKKRKTRIVDITGLKKESGTLRGNAILSGHLSHFAKCGICIVLRASPPELEARLKKRKWSKSKIAENVEAEVLDACLIEAVREHGLNKVFEINTTGITPRKAAEKIGAIIAGRDKKKYRPGKTDWTKFLQAEKQADER